jgi:hypothetical protein
VGGPARTIRVFSDKECTGKFGGKGTECVHELCLQYHIYICKAVYLGERAFQGAQKARPHLNITLLKVRPLEIASSESAGSSAGGRFKTSPSQGGGLDIHACGVFDCASTSSVLLGRALGTSSAFLNWSIQNLAFELRSCMITAAPVAIGMSFRNNLNASIARFTDFRADGVGGQTGCATAKPCITNPALQRI